MPDSPIAIIIIAMIAPLAIAAAVGMPTWIVTRLQGEHQSLVADYRAAVGLESKPEESNEPEGLYDWKSFAAYMVFVLVSQLLPKSITFGLIAISMLLTGFFLAYCVIDKARQLKSHPDIEDRLKKVPRIEAMACGTVALAAFGMAAAFWSSVSF